MWPCFTTGQGRGSSDRGMWPGSVVCFRPVYAKQVPAAFARCSSKIDPAVWLLVPCRASPDSPPRRESAVPTSAKLAAGDCRAHHHYCEQCSHDNVSATHSGSAPSYFPLSHTVILHNADPLGGRMAPLDSPMALVSGGVNPPSGGCGLRIQTMTGTNGSTAV